MKKRIIVTLLLGIFTFVMIGCSSKVKNNTNIQDIEGSGNLIISSNLMNAVNTLGKSYEFVPLEYKNGVVRGIISPNEIEEYTLNPPHQNIVLNPLRYMEYTVDAIQPNSFIEETGKIIELNEKIPNVLDLSNPKNIILKDNKRKIEKTYTSKGAESFFGNVFISYDARDGREIKFNDFINIDGDPVSVKHSDSEIVGMDNRYLYSTFGYTEEIDEYSQGKNYKNILVVYDSQTEKFYESEIASSDDYNYQGNTIFEINNEIYLFEYNGKINKITLKDDKILFEEYYDLQLSENEVLTINYAYTNNSIKGDNVVIGIGSRTSDGLTTYSGNSVFNIKDKSIINLPVGENHIGIEKIFSNSDNLAMVSTGSFGEDKWIAKYENGEFKKLVKLGRFSNNGTPIQSKIIANILYDDETNSFFIKRKVTIDKKQRYQYEVLKLE